MHRFGFKSFILTLILLSACSPLRPVQTTPATTVTITTSEAIRLPTATFPTKVVTPEPFFPSPTMISTTETSSSSNAASHLANSQLLGDVFVLLRPVKPPFLLALGKLPASCLLKDCPPIEIIYQDSNAQQPVLRQAPLVFSPDGKTAWWNNDFQNKIFSLNTETKAIQTVAQGIPAINGEFQWSPDGKWVALAVQGNDAYSGHVMLLNSENGDRRIYLNSPNEVKFPIGWINEEELIVRITRNGPPDDDPNGKWVEKRSWVALLDIKTGQAREVLNGLFGVSPSSLSPDRQWFAFRQSIQGKNSLFLHAFSHTGERTIDLHVDSQLIGWSPNSQWIAIQDTNGAISVLHPDGSEQHQVISIPSENMTFHWFFDSQHLLMMEHTFDMKADRDGVELSIVSIQDGKMLPVKIPGLNKADFLVDDLFYQRRPE